MSYRLSRTIGERAQHQNTDFDSRIRELELVLNVYVHLDLAGLGK